MNENEWDLFEDDDAPAEGCSQLHRAGVIGQQLDDVLLSVIFGLVSGKCSFASFVKWQQTAAVCRHFRQIIHHEKACWDRLILTSPHDPVHHHRAANVTDSLVCRLALHHGPQIRHIHLDGARITGAAVSTIAMNCASLRTVTLVGCVAVGSRAIQLLARRCPYLEQLRVAMAIEVDDSSGRTSQSDRAVEVIASSCSSLRSISLAGLRSDSTLSQLLLCCPITALDLAGCNELRNSQQLQTALRTRGPELLSLKLGGWHRLTDVTGWRLRKLRTLFLGGCHRLADDCGLDAALQSCAHSLQLLSMVGCSGLSPSALLGCLKPPLIQFEVLSQLILGGCNVDDEVCVSIASSCPVLTSIDLWNCVHVSSTGVSALMALLPLTELNVRESRNVAGDAITRALCSRQSAESSKRLLSLETLDISFISLLEDEDVRELFTQSPASLKFVACGGSDCAITEASLERLPHTITALDITECFLVGDFSSLQQLNQLNSLNLDELSISSEQLIEIFGACPLTSLSLAGCNGVTDHVLLAIARLLPDLFGIELRRCVNIHDSASVEALVKSCQLTHLGLEGTHVSREAVGAAREALPSCDVVWSGSFDDY